MSNVGYNSRLHEKMELEQKIYRSWLLEQTPEEILNHTYEYTMREDIVMLMGELRLESEKAKALLRSPCPLEDVYKNFSKKDAVYLDLIRDSIEEEADKSFWRWKESEN